MEEEVITRSEDPAMTSASPLSAEQIKHLDNLMCSYNEKILEPLRQSYNRRQRHTNKLVQLFLQYRVTESTDYVHVVSYLTTHDKLLDTKTNVVLYKHIPSEPFAIRDVHEALRNIMVTIMRNGLGYVIRRSSKLPDELI